MINPIRKITEKLFEDIPYSKISEEAQQKIENSLENEYSRLSESGCNEMQALGNIMQNYGSIDDAAGLAEITDTDRLKSAENAVSKKVFVKQFTKFRIFSILSAVVFSGAVLNILNAVIFTQLYTLIFILLSLIIGTLLLLPCKKLVQSYRYENVILSPEARERFYIYSDRYKKRTVNSFLLLIVLTMNFISLTFERAALADMNIDELRALIISNNYYLQIGVIICIKNVLYTAFLCSAANKEIRTASKKYIIKSAVICGIFLVVSVGITAILNIFIYNPYIILYILTFLFISAFIIINHKKRIAIVISNIRINKPRIAVFTAAALAAYGIHYMKADTWVLQPYISTVRSVEHTAHDISYDDETGVFTISANDDDFKILHLTDIHIGGSAFSAYKDVKALEACRKLLEHTHPDLVVVTGDMVFPMGLMSLSLNNQAPVMQFANFMRNTGIPWAFTFGNHDTESMATGSREDICSLYESLSYINSGNLLYPDVQPKITGRSNQMIKIQNPDGSIRQALFLIDSNDYTGAGLNDYDYIHDDQVDWYSEQVKSLGSDVKSMVFFHIPLRQYADAYELYQQGSSETEYYFGIIGETMINPICYSNYDSKLFDTAVRLGSTQAMFCGHDHYNNISMKYKGIRLSYGMSIDYLAMPGISHDTEQRGGEVITIKNDGTFDLEQIPLTSIT